MLVGYLGSCTSEKKEERLFSLAVFRPRESRTWVGTIYRICVLQRRSIVELKCSASPRAWLVAFTC